MHALLPRFSKYHVTGLSIHIQLYFRDRDGVKILEGPQPSAAQAGRPLCSGPSLCPLPRTQLLHSWTQFPGFSTNLSEISTQNPFCFWRTFLPAGKYRKTKWGLQNKASNGERKKKSLKCNSSLDVTKLKMSLGLPPFKNTTCSRYIPLV